MRLLFRAALLLACLATLAAAWSKEDHEIFRLKDEVQASEGPNATFYSFIGVEPSANNKEIDKAYRKLSRTLHPDKARSAWIAAYNAPKPSKTKAGAKPTTHVHKNKQPSQGEIKTFMKTASARFERLSLVINVLRGAERARYDHFLHNGFPAWRGTGYYYERFRPGLGSVLLGLFVFVGGAVHYGALYMGYVRQREFVERYIKHARRMAWGDDSNLANIPGLAGAGGAAAQSNASTPRQQTPSDNDESMQWNRKQKRAMEREKKSKKNGGVGNGAAAKNSRAAEKARTEGVSTPVEAELTSGPVGAKKRTVAENGKILIVDSVGNVFLEDETEEGDTHEFLLDPTEIPIPTFSDTFLYRGPKFLYNKSLGRFFSSQTPDHVAWEANGEPLDESVPEISMVEPSLSSAVPANAQSEGRRRKIKR
ncbi:hypothetical protein Q7P37_002998 [Cladosporium fusiforme]